MDLQQKPGPPLGPGLRPKLLDRCGTIAENGCACVLIFRDQTSPPVFSSRGCRRAQSVGGVRAPLAAQGTAVRDQDRLGVGDLSRRPRSLQPHAPSTRTAAQAGAEPAQRAAEEALALTNRSRAAPARPVACRPARAAIAPNIPRLRRGRPRGGRGPVLLVLPAALIKKELGVQLANVRSPLTAELDPG